jgi:thioredoxin-like negative regulator of GroEL
MRNPRAVSALGVVGTLSWLILSPMPLPDPTARAQAQPQPAAATTPQSTAAFDDAFALLRQKQFEKAVSAFKKALQKEPGSARGYIGLAEAYEGLGDDKSAIRACDTALALTEDPLLQAGAFNTKGIALFARACLKSKPDGEDMAAAEQQFRAALHLNPHLHIVRYNLGMLQLKAGGDAAGVEWLSGYLAADPRGPMAASARSMIENPRRARENVAPGFSVVTEEGERLDLERLTGKVVLLDFWASWCGPCRQTIPILRDLATKYKGAPVVFISVSVDRDAGAWRDAMVSEKMTWPQCRDADGAMASRFSVGAIPTVVVIDGDGIVRDRVEGYQPGYEARLGSGIQKWTKALKK